MFVSHTCHLFDAYSAATGWGHWMTEEMERGKFDFALDCMVRCSAVSLNLKLNIGKVGEKRILGSKSYNTSCRYLR